MQAVVFCSPLSLLRLKNFGTSLTIKNDHRWLEMQVMVGQIRQSDRLGVTLLIY